MSYFCIENNISEDKENMTTNETPSNVEKRKRDHRGELNPHFGHIMSQESRDKIASKQRQRYEMISKLVRKGMAQPIDEERVKQICGEVIEDYFKRNLIEVKQNNKKPMNINL